MLVPERRQRVLDMVSRHGFVRLTDLAGQVGVSESTVRRDLDYWQQQRLLKRIHGGAMFVGDGGSLPALEERTGNHPDEKRQIAEVAAERIHDGDAVLLDGGTTTLEVAKLLVDRPIQVVTNSLPIAQLLASSRETDLVMLGGYVYPKTGVALGPQTARGLEEVHVHQAILSVGGITAKGLFNSNLLLVETERGMMRAADEVVVVADSSKFGRQALAYLCRLGDVDTLISDGGAPEEYRRLLEESGVRLIAAARPNRNGAGDGAP